MTESLGSQEWPGKPRVTAQSRSLIWAGLHPETVLGTGHCSDTQQATFVRASMVFLLEQGSGVNPYLLRSI